MRAITHNKMRHSTNNANPAVSNPSDAHWTEEHPACAVCGGQANVPLVVRNGHQVVRCRQCRLVFVSPRPRSRAPVDALYTDESYSAGQVSKASSAGRMREAGWRLDRLERFVRRRGRLLDVGCSAGSFLVAARERGWDVRGIDVSPAAITHAHQAHGLDVSVGTLEESGLARHSFDVVTVFECIEHMLNPRAALRAASSLLRDGGLLVITTPNVDGFVPRVTYWTLGRTLGAWEHPTPPHHLYQFSRRTLTALLRDAGFGITSCETRPMGLRYTVKEMESAIVEALWRRFRGSERGAAGDSGSPGGAEPSVAGERSVRPWNRVAAAMRRLARRFVAGLCWFFGLTLYALPARALDVGDSMIVIARKT